MKICMVSTHLASGGGVSSYTKNLVRSLRGREVNVFVFSNKPEKAGLEEDDKGIYACWNRGILYPFQIFKALVASKNVNLVHLQHEFFLYGGTVPAVLFPFLLVLVRLFGKPIVVTLHGVIPLFGVNNRFKEENELRGPLLLLKLGLMALTKAIVSLSDAVIVHGRFFAEILRNEYRCPKGKIHVIPHGVKKVATVIPQNEAKKMLRLKNKSIILFFGYIAKYKGIETLIEAFGQLAKKHQDWVLIVGGKEHPRLCTNPKYKEYVFGLQQKGFSLTPERIIFTGFIPEEKLPLYFSATDIVVLPYTIAMSSSGPLALAISYGKPVIASDIPSLRELISFEEALFKRRSSEGLAKKLELMFNDSGLRHRISVHIKKMREENSWSEVSLQTCMLYQKICNSSASCAHLLLIGQK